MPIAGPDSPDSCTLDGQSYAEMETAGPEGPAGSLAMAEEGHRYGAATIIGHGRLRALRTRKKGEQRPTTRETGVSHLSVSAYTGIHNNRVSRNTRVSRKSGMAGTLSLLLRTSA